jgi:hypothetical protein
MKPGWRTTEFWVVVAAAVLSIGTAMGLVTPDQAAEIENATAAVIDSITQLVGALTPLLGVVAYVWSRTKVKTDKNL